jgi:glycosyltransferase involved in cell wall biosynthesis
MTINVLISTLNEGIQKVPNVLQIEQSGVTYIIVHQFTVEKYKDIPKELIRPDVKIVQVNEKGLSKSRNRAIELADAEIAVLADDDVRYLPNTLEIIRAAYAKLTDADGICFKIKTPEGSSEYKEYSNTLVKLKRNFVHYPSSIEITFKVQPIRSGNIRFDNRFGLGSELYKSAEEDVFLDDCIKKGLNLYFVPEYIVVHELESSSKNLDPYGSYRNELAGALYYRKYKWKAFPQAILATMRSIKILKVKERSLLVFLIERWKGALNILFSNPKY